MSSNSSSSVIIGSHVLKIRGFSRTKWLGKGGSIKSDKFTVGGQRWYITFYPQGVFKAMLHFIYTDSLPEIDAGEKMEMAQHLFVAADRYDLERLKLICEEIMCNQIGARTVATTWELAEQHGLGGLKEACFEFLKSASNILKSAMASDGFKHLRSSCPSVLHDTFP